MTSHTNPPLTPAASNPSSAAPSTPTDIAPSCASAMLFLGLTAPEAPITVHRATPTYCDIFTDHFDSTCKMIEGHVSTLQTTTTKYAHIAASSCFACDTSAPGYAALGPADQNAVSTLSDWSQTRTGYYLDTPQISPARWATGMANIWNLGKAPGPAAWAVREHITRGLHALDANSATSYRRRYDLLMNWTRVASACRDKRLPDYRVVPHPRFRDVVDDNLDAIRAADAAGDTAALLDWYDRATEDVVWAYPGEEAWWVHLATQPESGHADVGVLRVPAIVIRYLSPRAAARACVHVPGTESDDVVHAAARLVPPGAPLTPTVNALLAARL